MEVDGAKVRRRRKRWKEDCDLTPVTCPRSGRRSHAQRRDWKMEDEDNRQRERRLSPVHGAEGGVMLSDMIGRWRTKTISGEEKACHLSTDRKARSCAAR